MEQSHLFNVNFVLRSFLLTCYLHARSVSMVTACTAEACQGEGLVETYSLPKYLLVARSLTRVGPNQEVILQVINTGPAPIKLYKAKGAKVGEFISRQCICVVDNRRSNINRFRASRTKRPRSPSG